MEQRVVSLVAFLLGTLLLAVAVILRAAGGMEIETLAGALSGFAILAAAYGVIGFAEVATPRELAEIVAAAVIALPLGWVFLF